MKQTTNMKLNKPEYSDVVDIEKLNENFDKIDSKIAEVSGQIVNSVATTSKGGLMSKDDKIKLDGISKGANKTVVDSAMSESSSNPVQNKVVKQYIDSKAFNGGSGSVTVDASMSDTSTNPVQNKVIKAYVDDKAPDDYVVNITFDNTSNPMAIDDSNIAVFNASTDKTFAEISSAVAEGKNVYGMLNGHKWPLYRSDAVTHMFRGHVYLGSVFGNVGIAVANCVISKTSCVVNASAGELPAPMLDDTDDGKSLVVNGHKWEMKKSVVAVDLEMSDESENPVQNKIIKAYVDSKTAATGDAGYYDIKATATSGGQGTSIEGFSCTTISTGTLQGAISDGKTLRVVISIDTKKIILPLVYYRKSTLSSNPFYATFSGMDKTSDGVYLYTVIFDSENGIHGTWTAHSTKVSDIIIDESLSGTSTNPVQNKAVKIALDAKASTAIATQSTDGLMSAADKQKLDGIDDNRNITVDAALDASSTNPVQNKVIKAALDGKINGTTDANQVQNISGALRAKSLEGEESVSAGAIHLYEDSTGVAKMTYGVANYDDTVNPARLKIADPTEDDDAVTKKYVDDRAVRYDESQELTSVQKFRACQNIGAVSQKYTFVEGSASLLPLGKDGAYVINITPNEKNNDYTITLDAGPENVNVYVSGIETPTDAQTSYAANVEYVKAKIAEVAVSGGVDVDNALLATSTNPVQNKVVTAALTGKAGTAVATQSANGLMSKADKTKLDGIAKGATKVTVDSVMSASSTNPVANHVVKQYVDDKVAATGNGITVDTSLSSTSTNPVQNKAVKTALDNKADKTALDAKADKTALDGKLDKTGGTLTGNLTGKYITGTWLQATAVSDLGKAAGKIAVLDDSGWLYYRAPSEMLDDIGGASKEYVDSAITQAINNAY